MLIDELNRVIRYSMDTLTNLLSQTQPENWQPGAVHRLVTADAMTEAGREAEGHLLRSEHPIYFWRGKAHLGRDANNARRADRFAQEYLQTALDYSPVDRGNDPHALDESLGMHFNESHLTPETKQELLADARHFYPSNEPLHHFAPFAIADAARSFWGVRNGQDWAFDNDQATQQHARELDEAARATGPYTLHLDHDGPDAPDSTARFRSYIRGEGGEHEWGQQPGLR